MSDDDLDTCVAAFQRTGLSGAPNRYRAMPHDVATSADIVGATVDQPSCFVAGEHDPGQHDRPRRRSLGAAGGPAEVNAALDAFLAGL